MNTISREDLKARLDRGDDFKLVLVLGEWAFRAKHIPGSLNVFAPNVAEEKLDKNDDIVVYCSDTACAASRMAYQQLIEAGYEKVARYDGGLADWEAHGLPLEGEMVD